MKRPRLRGRWAWLGLLLVPALSWAVVLALVPTEWARTRMADRLGVEEVRTLVTGIAQGKRLGAGTEMILRDQELLVRMAQRNRATASASQISTRLMGVLVGVYLPEFVILVMVPLFWGVMLRAFG